MTSHSTIPNEPQSETETAVQLFDNWFDPIEAGRRDRAREFLQAMLEAEHWVRDDSVLRAGCTHYDPVSPGVARDHAAARKASGLSLMAWTRGAVEQPTITG